MTKRIHETEEEFKARRREYGRTQARRDSRKRYAASDRGKAAYKRYRSKSSFRELRKSWDRKYLEKIGVAVKNKKLREYYHSEKGLAYRMARLEKAAMEKMMIQTAKMSILVSALAG